MAKFKVLEAAKAKKEVIYQTFEPLKNIPKPTNDIFKVGRLEDLGNIDFEKPLFCDTETAKSNKGICMFQCMQQGWDKALVFLIKDTEKELRPIYEKIKDCLVVYHNFSYDASSFANDLKLDCCPFEKFEDTFFLARCLFWDNEFFNLEECYRRTFGFSPYECVDIDKKKAQKYFYYKKINLDDIEPNIWLYSAIDVYYMPYFWRWCKNYTDMWHYRVDKRFIYHMVKWQQYGMPVDFEQIELAKQNNLRIIEENKKLLPQDLNVNSPRQVTAYLNIESSSREELSRVVFNDPANSEKAEAILNTRKAIKSNNFLSRLSFKRIRGYFSPSTKSGRAKCEGTKDDGEDNLLQVPRNLKQVFGFAKDENKLLVYCDYAQLELRSATALLGENNLRKAFDADVDLHEHTAALMFNLPIDNIPKEKRQFAKMCNFALLYCASVPTLQQVFYDAGSKLSIEETAELRRKWKGAYKKVAQWHHDSNKQYDSGKLDSITINLRHYLPKFFADMCGIANQSLGADAAKIAACLFCEKFPKAKVLCFIHDAIVVEANTQEEAKEYAKGLGDCMVIAWFAAIKNCIYADLLMPLEVEVSKNLSMKDAEVMYKTSGKWEDYSKMFFEEIEINSCPVLREVILDADYILYVEAIEAEQNDESLDDLKARVMMRVKAFRECYGTADLRLAITGSKVFRYSVDENYKAYRHKRPKPKYLKELREWVKQFSNCIYKEELEADDICALFKQQHPQFTIVSNDKDVLKSVVGRHYDLFHQRFIETSEAEAIRFNYYQCLCGDVADSVVGIRGVGDIKAEKILSDCKNEEQLYNATIRAYKANGLSEEDLIRNMRLVKLGQYSNGKVKLWEKPNF